jgi:hypothetical protein
MNAKLKFLTVISTAAVLSAVIVTIGTRRAGLAQETESPEKARIGVYDSRAVAVAFAGSEPFKKWMGDLTAEHKKAKASGDLQRVKELEAEGAARQQRLHMQGFSTAPVTNILEYIQEKLPAIQEKAGVSVLISKWDDAGLAQYKDAGRVDVTMALVDSFNPGKRQRDWAIDVQKKKPIPLDEAKKMKD